MFPVPSNWLVVGKRDTALSGERSVLTEGGRDKSWVMRKLMEQAIASLATLPEADQEKIGQQLLDHVSRLKALRAELRKGLDSLEAGQGKPVDIEEFIRRAHDRHGGS